jgi:glycosyltransferase involved in cell wall biosynthesis
MALVRKNLSIVLYGALWCNNRCEFLIEHLIASGYNISCVFPEYYTKTRNNRNAVTKFFNKLTRPVFTFLEFWVKASFADVIYILPSNPQLINHALLAQKWFKNKIVFELYDTLYPTYLENKGAESISVAPEDLKIVKKDNVNLNPENERKAFRQSDYIIHITHHETEFLTKLLEVEVPKEKIYIAPLFCPIREIHQRPFMADGIFRMCWWGGFLPAHGLDYILAAMQRLKDKQVNFTCDLFAAYAPGSLAYFFKKYEAKIKAEGLDSHVKLRRDLTFADGQLPQYLIHHCDLALGLFGGSAAAANSVPNKLVEALAMRIPTLTRSAPALDEFFNVDSDLWTCEPDPDAMATAIEQIYHQQAPAVNWDKTREKVIDTFNAQNYRTVVSQVLDQVSQSLA